ncbi:hypothetical protein GYMLUDRAFT_64809 [Collybiopsis luxurians FD-317 M1]|uniref:Uncharacterized protein n=1 Tax=Collybiopsis luxurians FD-317 M1 TaxID=944289 RepID=A0A0D0C9G1_9AGAR|nr:hypothetical protein GYMLUDRAFT_64809 [Collybiopsis luxurians FD-317 M1]
MTGEQLMWRHNCGLSNYFTCVGISYNYLKLLSCPHYNPNTSTSPLAMTLNAGPTIAFSVSEVSSMISDLQSIQNKLLNAATSEKENCEVWVPPSATNQDLGELNDFSQMQMPGSIDKQREATEHVWDLTSSSQRGQTLDQLTEFAFGSISSLDTDSESEMMDPSTIAFTVLSSDVDLMHVPPPPPPMPISAATVKVNCWSLVHMLVYKVKGGIMQSFGSYAEASGEFKLLKDLGLVKVMHTDI